MGANGSRPAVPDDVAGVAVIPFTKHDLTCVEPARDSHLHDPLEVVLREVREDRHSRQQLCDLISGSGHGRR